MSDSPIQDAIYAALTASTELASLLHQPTAIYARSAPQDARRPYVVFRSQSGLRALRAFGGPDSRNQIWLVKGVSDGPDSSKGEAIDAAIDAALDKAELSIDDFDHLYLVRESDVDYLEPDGANTIFHIGGNYRLIAHPQG